MAFPLSASAGGQGKSVPSAEREGSQSAFSATSFPPVNLSFSIKLDRTNYLIWKEQVLSVIIAYGLEAIIDPCLPPPTQYLPDTFIVSSEYNDWNRLNNLVKSWFYGSVAPSMHLYLKRGASAAEQWLSLGRVFSASSNARIMDLRLQLQTLTKDGLSAEEYILKLRTVADHLSAVGETVSDRDLVLYGLGGLDFSYNPFVSSFMRAECVTFEEFHSELLTYERRLDRQHSRDANLVFQANLANSQYKNFSSSRFSGGSSHAPWNLQDFLQKSHASQPQKQNANTGNSKYKNKKGTTGSKIQCQVCGKLGHGANKCFQLRDLLTGQGGHSSQGPSAMMASGHFGQENGSVNWLLDSGATHHLTNDSSNVTNDNTPFLGSESVTVGSTEQGNFGQGQC